LRPHRGGLGPAADLRDLHFWTDQGAASAPFSFSSAAVDTPIEQKGWKPMITEIAQIDVKPGSEKDFEAAVAKAKAAFGRSKGFHGFELHKSIEKPQRYRLMVKWATLENHTVDFRGSENFAEWRGLVGQYFASPPEVEHTETVLTS
jgi:heme-degrading monooxygenase HmoA